MRNRLVEIVGKLMARDPSTVFLTGDLGYSVLGPLRETFGPRFINVGVAEANLISVATGLGVAGFKPLLYSACPFLTLRAFEQIRNDLVFHRVPARLFGVGAGFTYGSQGPSHHALEDLHLMTSLPGTVVAEPATDEELEFLFSSLEGSADVVYFRVGADRGSRPKPGTVVAEAYRVRHGKDVNLVVSGNVLGEAVAACALLERRGISVNLVSCPLVRPFPAKKVLELLVPGPVVSLCEAYAGNPLEAEIMALLLSMKLPPPFTAIHAPRSFPIKVGDKGRLRDEAGLSAEAIAKTVQAKKESALST